MKKFQYNSPVVISFFLISFAALVLGWLSNNWTTASLFSVYRSSFRDPFTYIRLISHVLGHADLEHFFGNMLMFLVIGPPLEERYGSRVLLTGILLTALVSGLLQTVLFPNSALLGASGIVFMLIMLSSLSGMEDGGIPVTLILVAVLYLGRELYSILFIKDDVANLMHIIGGICGTAYGFLISRKQTAMGHPSG